ncbi:unnamed protein product [Rotaria magnacalcarata]|uniref:Uncharacterized protein n=2 Tax=Rotaria magnacalcarata TaxID=392030 RepID=A0A816PAZ0_9BILA|nr:unnamed protein product [Rotaria magnacalcarata]CAF2046273.1 unnamed protein product [Rotaria magnacalcarata]CAF2138412.1 unnamed protein product [Rotaria magnacalcarata]CAF3754612.1 unnamed protein product [Rotaria magnacalcarata]CAF3818010.1 unnamed protein product [Rotaria magnacalcarata]
MANTKQRIDRWSSSEKTTLNVTQLTYSRTPTVESMSNNDNSEKNQSLINTKIDDIEHLHLPEITQTKNLSTRSTPSDIMTQQAFRLAEKINDQYLTCKICLEPFKDPKCLTCLHTFCEQCIESHVSAQRSYKYTDYREFACPICRKKTAIPSGGVQKLPDNFLIAGLSEMITQKSLGANGSVKVSTNCEICKTVHDREREATSRCLECQKSLCRHCVQAHQTITITRNHSIYELEIEKDILCKHHQTEFVRYYCEQCETCICIACTYADHRDHELSDFRAAAANHKAYINECLDGCKARMSELEAYLNVIRRCDANIAQIEASIHSLASTFEKSLRIKEQELIQQITELYGDETNEFIKRREELDEYYEQIKNTCSLTELVIHGKDIELLLVKKQLLEKFRELDAVELDPLPENICMRIDFQPGQLTLGTLKICEVTPIDDDECEGELEEEEEVVVEEEGGGAGEEQQHKQVGQHMVLEEEAEEEEEEEGEEDDDNDDEEEEEEDDNDDEEEQEDHTENDEKNQINNKIDYNNINSKSNKTFASIAIQTEDVETTTQTVQTMDISFSTNDLNFENGNLPTSLVPTDENGSLSPTNIETSSSAPPVISSDMNTNIYEQSNKLSRRVRRLLKPTCSVAVLPNTDVIILDCEQNLASILDKKGKFKYCFTSEIPPTERKGFAVSGFSSTASVSAAPAGSNRTVRIPTQQGLLCIKLKGERVSELPFGFTIHAFNSISESDN